MRGVGKCFRGKENGGIICVACVGLKYVLEISVLGAVASRGDQVYRVHVTYVAPSLVALQKFWHSSKATIHIAGFYSLGVGKEHFQTFWGLCHDRMAISDRC